MRLRRAQDVTIVDGGHDLQGLPLLMELSRPANTAETLCRGVP